MRQQVYQGGNHFRIGAISGLLTGVAAGTASAGHIFAARWNPPTNAGGDKRPKFALVTRLKAQLVTITGYTAEQEVGIDASIVRAYTASHTGGTAIPIPTLANGNTNKKRSVAPFANSASADSVMADLRIATTAALTNGTETFDSTAVAVDAYEDLADAAAVAAGRAQIYLSTEDLSGHPIVLSPSEGIVIRNRILMGAGGTARLIVELDWAEVDAF